MEDELICVVEVVSEAPLLEVLVDVLARKLDVKKRR